LKAASSLVVFADGGTLWSKHVESIANKWNVTYTGGLLCYKTYIQLPVSHTF